MAERALKATLTEKRDGVGIITLNRPEKLNAINQDIMDDLYYLFDAYEEDPEVRVIVLTGGDGKAFCAGGDIEGEIQMDVVGSYHGGISSLRSNSACIWLRSSSVPLGDMNTQHAPSCQAASVATTFS